MSKLVKYSLILLSFIALVASSIWFFNDMGWDSGITALTCLTALLALPFTGDKGNLQSKMSQKAGKNSKQYQTVKGNITIK